MATAAQIEKDVPLPPSGCTGPRRTHPFHSMKVGDSFFVPVSNEKRMRLRANYLTYARAIRLKNKTKFQVTSRAVEGGLRFWRIA